MISIRVLISLVTAPGSAPNPAPADPPADSLRYHYYLIEGKFEEIERYAGATADWIIKVAHLICNPLGEGQVYTHTMDTPEYWHTRVRTNTWREVVPGDPLLPGIYEFHSANPITLSKISERQTKSRIYEGSTSNATAFRNRIMDRDSETCVVSGQPRKRSLKASHLIPKRMGTTGAIEVLSRFSGVQETLDISRFDPRFGISLFNPLDDLVDVYELGFYHTTGNTYIAHNFDKEFPCMTIHGTTPVESVPSDSAPILHLYSITLSDKNGSGTLPHPGIFDWHYLQCVLKAFGTPEYKNMEGIRFFVYPFRTDSDSDDSDDQYTDIDEIDPDDPPWPSYNFDKFLREQGEIRMARERHEAVVKWSSEVASSN